MCCDSRGRKESDTTERLDGTGCHHSCFLNMGIDCGLFGGSLPSPLPLKRHLCAHDSPHTALVFTSTSLLRTVSFPYFAVLTRTSMFS